MDFQENSDLHNEFYFKLKSKCQKLNTIEKTDDIFECF